FEGIPADGIDGEVAPSRGFSEGHQGVAADLEAFVAASLLGLATGNRHVDIARPGVRRHDLVDRKALADGLDATEVPQQTDEPVGGDAEDLDVDVLGWPATKAVAHPSANHERASTGGAGGAGDAGDEVNRGFRGHSPIMPASP